MKYIILDDNEIYNACLHDEDEGILFRPAESKIPPIGSILTVCEKLWISDCGQYYAQKAPSPSIADYDVISLDGTTRWFSKRKFEDPYPSFIHQVGGWKSLSKFVGKNLKIAFELQFHDFDTIDLSQGARVLKTYSAQFRKQISALRVPKWANRIEIEITSLEWINQVFTRVSYPSVWKLTYKRTKYTDYVKSEVGNSDPPVI
jgi:hypothetical protein